MTDFKSMSDADLDAWIAVHVMGFTPVPDQDEPRWKDATGCLWWDWNPTHRSEGWNDVMKAAKEMRNRGVHFCILIPGDSRNYHASAFAGPDHSYALQMNNNGPRAMSEAIAMAWEAWATTIGKL